MSRRSPRPCSSSTNHRKQHYSNKLQHPAHIQLAQASPCNCLRRVPSCPVSSPLPPSTSSSSTISPSRFFTADPDPGTPQSHSHITWNHAHSTYLNNSTIPSLSSDSLPSLEPGSYSTHPLRSSSSAVSQRSDTAIGNISSSSSDSVAAAEKPTELASAKFKHDQLPVEQLRLDSPAELTSDTCWLDDVYSRHFLGRDHLLSCVLQQSLEANGGDWIIQHRQQLLQNIATNGFTLTVNVQGETMLHALSDCTHLASKYPHELAEFFYLLFQLLLKQATPQIINSRNFQTGETALYRLLSPTTPATNFPLVLLLRSHGADVNCISLSENNPSSFMHYLIQTCDCELMLDWLEHEADLESIHVDVDFDFATERQLLQSQREATHQHIQPLSHTNQVGNQSTMGASANSNSMSDDSPARAPSVLSAAIGAARRAPHFHPAAVIADATFALKHWQRTARKIKSQFLEPTAASSPSARFPSTSSTPIAHPRSPSFPSSELECALLSHRMGFREEIRALKLKFNTRLVEIELCSTLEWLRTHRSIQMSSNFSSLTVPSALTSVLHSETSQSQMDDGEDFDTDGETDMASEYGDDSYVESSAEVAVHLLNSRLPTRNLDFAQASRPDTATHPRPFLLRSIVQLSPAQLQSLSIDAARAVITGVEQFCSQCAYGDLAAHKELIHIVIDDALLRHRPLRAGDFVWRLFHSLLRKYIQIERLQREHEPCTCAVRNGSTSSSSSASFNSCRQHAQITALWSWLHKITRRDHPSSEHSSLSTSSASSSVSTSSASFEVLFNETRNWSFESITIMLALFDSVGMQYDIFGQLLHDENYSVIIQLIRSYLSVDSLAIHPPSLPGNQTLFELLEERVVQTMEKFAANPTTTVVHPELTLVQAELCLWREGIWPVARGVLEEHLIPDLADLVMGHLMPVPEAARKNHHKQKKRKAECDIQEEESAKKVRSLSFSF